MISSDGARTGVVLLVVVGGLLPFALSCGVEGDLGRLGCPPGETCAPAPISFHVAEVSPCTWDAFPRRRSRAVAFGGTTRAEPTSAVRTEWSAHFAPATTGRLAVAVALGEGRFTARDADDNVIDFLSLPVRQVRTISVTDQLACPGEPRALLEGTTLTLRWSDESASGAILQPQMSAEDGTALVDLEAGVRGADGSETIIVGPDSVGLEVRYAGTTEIITLPVVSAIDDFAPMLSPTEQLAGSIVLSARIFGAVCFRATSSGALVLGVPAEGRIVEDLPDWSVGPFPIPGCLGVDAPWDAEATVTLEVTMAGLTRTFPIRAR